MKESLIAQIIAIKGQDVHLHFRTMLCQTGFLKIVPVGEGLGYEWDQDALQRQSQFNLELILAGLTEQP